MSARPLIAFALAHEPGPAIATALGAERVVLLGADDPHAAGDDPLAAAQHADVAWLPAWCAPGERAIADAADWRARAATTTAPRAARAALRLRCDGDTSIVLPPRLVLATSCALDALTDEPRLRAGVPIDDLATPWDVLLPDDLAAHLDSVNVQSSAAARLRHAAGREAAWRDLTLVPAAYAVRALAGTRGSRRTALPRVVIEAFREVLVATKLWELAHGGTA